MSREKFVVGEHVEMLCDHVRNGQRVNDWLAGVVTQVDDRMAAVQFDTDVFAANGWRIPDRTLWAAHGSPHLRQPTTEGVQ
jgi:hypothetical protein